ncbi:estrogen sulfotransferase-like isoform X1 [Lingula anatina]|uniref:Estrogen sulfotransferase-like isoform X1 n=1 Tax=Lingula anatina TaxID=7574 RepID=A0A1S3JI06_LINAN|nr:estrogen sulfotransferase-like isoform X1 [Lingula anatina]|eukprot:XP_013409998.1 estrogen sulfotransferase-like isoform X1 [Lingula anatina]
MTMVKMPDANGHTITMVKWQGEYFPPFPGTGSRMDKMKDLPMRDNDVLICSYPKSGTHWACEIARMLVSNKAENHHIEGLGKAPEYIDMSDQELVNSMKSPRVLFTHLPTKHLPKGVWEKKIKIIHLIRNPKDVAVSFSNFAQAFSVFEYKGNWDGFLTLQNSGHVPSGSWFRYMLDWWNSQKGNPNVLFITYEELSANDQKVVKKMAEFLNCTNTDEFYEEVARKCSFHSMKKSREDAMKIFFRKGQVGDWKNWFTVAQNEEFDKLFQEQMKEAPDLIPRIIFDHQPQAH